jgi:hypothetical protein
MVEILAELRQYVGDAPPNERREWNRWGGDIVRFGSLSFALRDRLEIGIGLARGHTGVIRRRPRRSDLAEASDGTFARFGRIDRSVEEHTCALRCRRTDARKMPRSVNRRWLDSRPAVEGLLPAQGHLA